MRVVSLNLDAADAAAIRRALAAATTACACGDGADGRLCPDCEAIVAVVADLDRLLTRPAPRRAMPPLTGTTVVPAGYAAASAGAQGSGLEQRTGSGSTLAVERHLWVLPGGLADGS
jgi:hypothetical protein